MAVTRVSDFAVDNLRIVDFFDPDAAFNYGTDDELSLVSRDGYELVFEGDDFDFNRNDVPTDGTITDVYLYDDFGDLVGRIDDISYSLEDYYDLVAVDNRPGNFTADLMSGADTITGQGADDHLEGYKGADSLSGGGGFDLLIGGSGNDTIDGGTGKDDIDGGSGDDRVFGGDDEDLIYGYTGDDTIDGGDGDDKIGGEAGNDVLNGGSQDDDIEGGSGDDTINGGSGIDVLGGGADNDSISGGSGEDTLFGDGGEDVLKGGSGEDSLAGGSGDDTLVGGKGEDVLFGGSGADRFQFAAPNEGGDLIQDFRRGEDVLSFKASGFANLDADFDLVVGGDPTADSGVATFLFDSGSGDLFYDADGDGAGDARFIAALEDVSNLSKNDFLIV